MILSGISVGFESAVYTAVVIAAAVYGAFLVGGSGVVALFAPAGDKVSFVVATTGVAREQGLAAGKLVGSFAPAIQGRGGGKPDMAQGGGTNPAGVDEAVVLLRRELGGA